MPLQVREDPLEALDAVFSDAVKEIQALHFDRACIGFTEAVRLTSSSPDLRLQRHLDTCTRNLRLAQLGSGNTKEVLFACLREFPIEGVRARDEHEIDLLRASACLWCHQQQPWIPCLWEWRADDEKNTLQGIGNAVQLLAWYGGLSYAQRRNLTLGQAEIIQKSRGYLSVVPELGSLDWRVFLERDLGPLPSGINFLFAFLPVLSIHDDDQADEDDADPEPEESDRQQQPVYRQIRAMLESARKKAPWTEADTRRLTAELRRVGLGTRPWSHDAIRGLVDSYETFLAVEGLAARFRDEDG